MNLILFTTHKNDGYFMEKLPEFEEILPFKNKSSENYFMILVFVLPLTKISSLKSCREALSLNFISQIISVFFVIHMNYLIGHINMSFYNSVVNSGYVCEILHIYTYSRFL